jgi:GNAT superfamily N-acetyltransferase
MAANDVVTLRRAQAGDASAIASIMRDVGWFAWVNAETQEQSVARIRGRLERYFGDDENRMTLVAEMGEVVGFICVHWMYSLTATEGFVSHLFVHSEGRGKGIGRKLLDAAQGQAKARGCTRLLLYIRNNREAYQRGFYPRAGWVEQGDAVLFERRVE